jgi:hypothetical protein
MQPFSIQVLMCQLLVLIQFKCLATAYSIYWRFFVSMAHKVKKEIAMGLHPSTFSIGFNQ